MSRVSHEAQEDHRASWEGLYYGRDDGLDDGRDGKKKSGFICVGNCHSRLYCLASCQNKEITMFLLPHCRFPNVWEKRFYISYSFT